MQTEGTDVQTDIRCELVLTVLEEEWSGALIGSLSLLPLELQLSLSAALGSSSLAPGSPAQSHDSQIENRHKAPPTIALCTKSFYCETHAGSVEFHYRQSNIIKPQHIRYDATLMN